MGNLDSSQDDTTPKAVGHEVGNLDLVLDRLIALAWSEKDAYIKGDMQSRSPLRKHAKEAIIALLPEKKPLSRTNPGTATLKNEGYNRAIDETKWRLSQQLSETTNQNEPIENALPPMNDTQPTGLDLEQILDAHAEYYIRQTMKFFQNEGESPALSKNNEGDMTAKQALTRWGLEQRVAELQQFKVPDQYEEYAKLMGSEHCRVCGFNAIVAKQYVDDRIAELQANLQDGAE